jgi:hypothetical protein
MRVCLQQPEMFVALAEKLGVGKETVNSAAVPSVMVIDVTPDTSIIECIFPSFNT